MTQDTAQRAHRARGLARQATEDRVRAEKTLETLRQKERMACLEALMAESADLQAVHGELAAARLTLVCAA